MEPNDRVSMWLKIVPTLLQHLNIRHVSLAAHSGGTIYALSTLLYLRHLLHPTTPYIALCAPWVHPSHSGTPLMSLVHTLPAGLVNTFDTVERFVNTTISPMVGFSTGLSSGLRTTARRKYPAKSADELGWIEHEEQLMPKILERIHRESVQGLSADALVLLKKTGRDDVWGAWRDVDAFVPMLANVEKDIASENEASKLKIEVFYAEEDNMIGIAAGPRWLDDCWRPEQRGDEIQYNSRFVDGTDHNNILNIEFGIMEHIFENIPGHGP